MEVALEAGADDIKREDDSFTVTCEPEVYSDVQEALEAAGIEVESSNVTRIPKDSVEATGNDARKLLKLMDALDNHDDVQGVSANFNVSEEAMAEIED